MSNRLQYRSQLSRCVEVLIPEERIRRLSVYCYLVLILWPVYLFLLPAVFVYGRWWVLLFMIFPGLYLFTWLGYLMHESWHNTITVVHSRPFPGMITLPGNAVFIVMNDYSRILSRMLKGEVDQETAVTKD